MKLVDVGYLRTRTKSSYGDSDPLLAVRIEGQTVYSLTVKGWETLQPVGGGLPGTCVAAMSFRTEMDGVYDNGIRPAIEADCGFDIIEWTA